MKNIYQLKNILIALFSLLVFISYSQTNVTFQVDMTQQTGFTTPEVNGTFNNWCGGTCNPMSDSNGDGIWEATIQLAPGNYEYKFAADNWNTQETLLPGSVCTVTNFGFTNRTLSVGTSNLTLPVVCWGSCASCPTTNPLTITIDLCGQNAQQVRMTGSFWNWAWNAGPVATNTGNGLWKIILNPPPTTSMDYLIVVDTVYENLITEMQNGATCAPLTDYATYANRVWSPGSTDSVYIYYDRCTACATGLSELDEMSVQLFPNPASQNITLKSLSEINLVQIFDMLGKMVFETQPNGNLVNIDVKSLSPGSYFIKISDDNRQIKRQFIINPN